MPITRAQLKKFLLEKSKKSMVVFGHNSVKLYPIFRIQIRLKNLLLWNKKLSCRDKTGLSKLSKKVSKMQSIKNCCQFFSHFTFVTFLFYFQILLMNMTRFAYTNTQTGRLQSIRFCFFTVHFTNCTAISHSIMYLHMLLQITNLI